MIPNIFSLLIKDFSPIPPVNTIASILKDKNLTKMTFRKNDVTLQVAQHMMLLFLPHYNRTFLLPGLHLYH